MQIDVLAKIMNFCRSDCGDKDHIRICRHHKNHSSWHIPSVHSHLIFTRVVQEYYGNKTKKKSDQVNSMVQYTNTSPISISLFFHYISKSRSLLCLFGLMILHRANNRFPVLTLNSKCQSHCNFCWCRISTC